MRCGRLSRCCDIIQFPLDRQKCRLPDRFEIDGFASKQQCVLAQPAVLKHDFRILKEELSVQIHDRRVKIKEGELTRIGSVIEKHLRRDLAAFGHTPCEIGP